MDFKTKLKKEEYEAQYFGFTSTDVAEGVKEILVDEITSAANAMKDCIIKNCKNDQDIVKINEATSGMINDYKNLIAEETKVMKVKIRNIITIPPHVLLPADENQKEQFTLAEEVAIDSDIAALEKRVKRALCMELLLKQELEQNKLSEVENRVDEVKNWDGLIEEEKCYIEEFKDRIDELIKSKTLQTNS